MSFFKGFARGLNQSLDRQQQEEQRRQSQELINLQAKQIKRQLEQEQLVKDQTAGLLKAIAPSEQFFGEAEGRTKGLRPDNPLFQMPTQTVPGVDLLEALSQFPLAENKTVDRLIELDKQKRQQLFLEQLLPNMGGQGAQSGQTGQGVPSNLVPSFDVKGGEFGVRLNPKNLNFQKVTFPDGSERIISFDPQTGQPVNIGGVTGGMNLPGQSVPTGGMNLPGQRGGQTDRPGTLVKPPQQDLPFADKDLINVRGPNGEFLPNRLKGSSKAEIRQARFGLTDKDTQKELSNVNNIKRQMDKLIPVYQRLFGLQGNQIPTNIGAQPPLIEQRQNLISRTIGNAVKDANETRNFSDIDDLAANSGWFKNVESRFEYLSGQNEELREYFDTVLPLSVQLARASGEVGTMTEGDVARAIAKLPFVGISLDDRGNVKILNLRQADSYALGIRKLNRLVDELRNKDKIVQHRRALGVDTPFEFGLVDSLFNQVQRQGGAGSGMSVNDAVGQQQGNQISQDRLRQIIEEIIDNRQNAR